MSGLRRTAIAAGVAAALVGPSGTVAAFELFGIRLWGAREPEQAVDIIDPLPYSVEITVRGGDDALDTGVRNASALWSDRDTPAAGRAGLISKARGDYRRLLAYLYSVGHFGPEISIRVAGTEAADLTLAADLPADVPISIEVVPGPAFRFGTAEIVNAPPFPPDETRTPASAGFATGEPALASSIGRAAALSIEQWRRLARAKAREADREIVANHPASALDAIVTLDPGPAVRIGPVRTEGSRRTDDDFILYMADLEQGAPYHPDAIEDARDRLSQLGIFRSLRFIESDDLGPEGSMPITIAVEDRRPRTIGFGGTYSTLDGLGLSAFWVNRNLFGRAERLRFDASIERLLATTDPADYLYNFGVTFTKPGLPDPDTSLVASLVLLQQDLEFYRERSLTGRIGFTRRFSRNLNGDLFLQGTRGHYTDDFGTRDFTTFGATARGEYDRRNDVLDPTEGYYLAADVNPFHEFEFGHNVVRGTVEGRGYLGFGEDRRFVLAGRARVGTYLGAPADESPPGLLYFAGGGGSIRGYEYRSIGVDAIAPDGDEVTTGGRGLAELSGEFRARLTENWGLVGFVDSGVVTESPYFTSNRDYRVGVGLGVRYYTGFGPLRVDLAAPVDPRPQDSAVALYIGIGQAF